MAQSKTYSHIEVGGADDDEVVIQTGAAAAPSPSASRDEQEGLDEEALPSEGAEEPDEAADEEPGAAAQQVEGEAGEASEGAQPARRPAYRETTKEDLDSVAPMSLTQKVVIGCVAVFIVAFVLYYVFLF